MPEGENAIFRGPTGGPSIEDFVAAVAETGNANRDKAPLKAVVVFEEITARDGVGLCEVRKAALAHAGTFVPESARGQAQTRIRDFFAERDAELLFGPPRPDARPRHTDKIPR